MAATFYIEVGPGVSTIVNSSSVFNNTFAGGSAIPSAFSANAMFAYVMPMSNQFAMHFGARGGYLNAINGTSYATLIGVYPFIRLDFWRVYVGAGASPISLYRLGAPLGIDGLTAATGIPLFAESGLEWKMIPDFALNLGLTVYGAYGSAGLSMLPSYEASLQFRFLFSIGGKSAAEAKTPGGPGKYDGWRYPFGIGK